MPVKIFPLHDMFALAPFRWPWPNYTQNTTVSRPTGWDFNNTQEATVSEWKTSGLDMRPGLPDYSLSGTVRSTRPTLLSPEFDCDALHIPLIEIDLSMVGVAGTDFKELVRDLRVYWRSDDQKEFTSECSVGIDYCNLPPDRFPEYYAPMVTATDAGSLWYFRCSSMISGDVRDGA